MDSLSQQIARFKAIPHEPWVWVLPVAGLGAVHLGALQAVLGADERLRAAAFRFERDALAYAAAHALLRWGLSERYGVPPTDWQFHVDERGKPSLAAAHATAAVCRFSLTHTDGLVAVGFGEAFDIGVDAESVESRMDLDEVARESFSAGEQAQLANHGADPAAREECFWALWTMKEALLKARGLGFHEAPHTFSVDVRALSVEVPAVLAPVHAWQLAWHRFGNEHFISVAMDAPAAMPAVPLHVIRDRESWIHALAP